MLIRMLFALAHPTVPDIRPRVTWCRNIGLSLITVAAGVKSSCRFPVLVTGVHLTVRWWNSVLRLMGSCRNLTCRSLSWSTLSMVRTSLLIDLKVLVRRAASLCRMGLRLALSSVDRNSCVVDRGRSRLRSVVCRNCAPDWPVLLVVVWVMVRLWPPLDRLVSVCLRLWACVSVLCLSVSVVRNTD